MRCNESGWICVAMHDPQGRRGLWYRESGDEQIELCAGREGDDSYIRIDRGVLLLDDHTVPVMEALRNLLADARFAFEEGRHRMVGLYATLNGHAPDCIIDANRECWCVPDCPIWVEADRMRREDEGKPVEAPPGTGLRAAIADAKNKN